MVWPRVKTNKRPSRTLFQTKCMAITQGKWECSECVKCSWFRLLLVSWFCIQIDYLTASNVPLTKLEAVGFTCVVVYPNSSRSTSFREKIKRKEWKKRFKYDLDFFDFVICRTVIYMPLYFKTNWWWESRTQSFYDNWHCASWVY